MKKITIALFSLLTCFIIIFSSCPGSDVIDEELCFLTCPPPESVGIDTAFLSDANPMGILETSITFSWPEVADANSYTLVISLNGVELDPVIVDLTTYTQVFQSLAIDSNISAKVASNCNCGMSAFSSLVAFIYKNGGGTLDIVPFRKANICASTAQFIRFNRQSHTLCDNSTVTLRHSNSGYVFYDRVALCNCLDGTDLPSTCVPSTNISNCLDTTVPRFIKTGL